MASPFGVAVGPDGSLYIADFVSDCIRRLGPDGIITTIVGSCGEYGAYRGYSGDGGPAIQAQLAGPAGVAVGPDGSLYIVDSGNNRIRRVGPDGIINTVAGRGEQGFGGDGGPATQAQLAFPFDVAVGPDGSLYIADSGNSRIRRVGPDGIITTVAGPGSRSPYCGSGYSGGGDDGGPATQAELCSPNGVAVGPDGSLYIADTLYNRIRRVGLDGIITNIANGTEWYGYSGDGGPATQAHLAGPRKVAVGPDGSLYIADTGNNRIRRVERSPFPSFNDSNFFVASADGRQLYSFDAQGRHLSTIDTLTGATLYSFAYDSAGRLSTLTDADGNVVRIERDGNGNPTAIVAPFGQRTTLSVDGSGYLSQVTNPAGESYRMTYAAGGLLTGFTDPQGQAATMTYDALGRLTKDTDPAGGSHTLARTDLTNGDGYTVTRTTGLNRATTYGLENLPTVDQRRTVRTPDGAETVTLLGTNGSTQSTAPDGTVTKMLYGPDPRFWMQAPVTQSLKITSGGQTTTASTTVTAVLSNPNDRLSLTTLTTTTTVNGRTAKEVYDAASRTTALTSAGGRQGYQIQDVKGRIIEAGVTGLDPVHFSYDARGRLSTARQGTGAEERVTTLEYGADGDLARATDGLGRVVTLARDNAGRVSGQTLPDLS